jgi:hypothetical protein
VQGHAADQLDVEMAHLQHPLASFSHGGEGFGQQGIQGFALGQAGAELNRLAGQRRVIQLLELALQCVDALDNASEILQQSVVATAENLGKELGQHAASEPGFVWRRPPARAGTIQRSGPGPMGPAAAPTPLHDATEARVPVPRAPEASQSL